MKNGMRNSLLGISAFYILLGLVMIIWPDASRSIACYALGAMTALYGVIRLFVYFTSPERELMGGDLLLGIIAGLLGLLIILRANAIMTILVALLGIFVITDSVVKIFYCLQLKRAGLSGWKGYLTGMCVLLAVGVFMLFDPFSSANAMIICAGVFLFLDGVCNLWTVIQANKYLKSR
ncbi:MAG: DUF308 domain-containing protein [Clostridia bacterium]|nr:DUF308 domain-containing protein [Clostridia bacterium]